MADNLMDAFLLQVDEDDSIRMELDRRIMDYAGDPALITRDVLVPFARELGYDMTVEDVEYYNGHANDGSEVPKHLLEGSDRH